MKKVCAFFLLLLSAVLGGDSSKCGDNYNLELNEDGTLFIRGSGEMENYFDDSSAPWYSQRDSIKTLKLVQGSQRLKNGRFFLFLVDLRRYLEQRHNGRRFCIL